MKFWKELKRWKQKDLRMRGQLNCWVLLRLPIFVALKTTAAFGAVGSNRMLYLKLTNEALVPRATQNNKSYAEATPPERNNKRRSKGAELMKNASKHMKLNYSYSVPAIAGAAAQVRGWSYGNLSKRDATRFF